MTLAAGLCVFFAAATIAVVVIFGVREWTVWVVSERRLEESERERRLQERQRRLNGEYVGEWWND